jgi:hypothetical protein
VSFLTLYLNHPKYEDGGTAAGALVAAASRLANMRRKTAPVDRRLSAASADRIGASPAQLEPAALGSMRAEFRMNAISDAT